MAHAAAWQEWEDRLLREQYPSQCSQIPGLLDHRSACAIMERAARLGVRAESGNPDYNWSKSDVALLKELYPEKGSNIPELRLRHSRVAICCKAKSLGLSWSRTWTETETKLLCDNFPECGANIPELLKTRSKAAIQGKARLLGLSQSRTAWTDEELTALREHYSSDGWDIPLLLKTKDKHTIQSKASRLGLRTDRNEWTAEEDTELKNAIIEERQPILPGRTESAVSTRLYKLGLKRSPMAHIKYRKEVGHAVTACDGWVYLTCAVCGKSSLLTVEKAITFNHECCKEFKEVPLGWKLPGLLGRLANSQNITEVTGSEVNAVTQDS